MTIDDVLATGAPRMRLPFWAVAYAEVDAAGPWMTVYDAGRGINGGEPIRMLVSEAGARDDWEPVDP